ncbi:uncharacterized protein LOC123308292 isoform X2 [Coccinella septempunctata]|uniref:uncharacterized protein LOC123308292 isoform X2 n=1 Tax=Coccinella septempunctata TaxID=41139 RepID=UPI001D0825B9|nr:uncharacterized protein LOC123308292 isoform X2 [Coccinella septempunctata]XP_044746831.1 uncharacterized protein LOC123308292 isoform X2 [Coccinella septempunctata]
MCKCCQSCLETLWWHMIEKRFCFDDEIALYEVPETSPEKNNNIFENAVFYDSVSVIAGRSVVTIEPLPTKLNGSVPSICESIPKKTVEPPVIISQPIPSLNSLPIIQLEKDSSSEELSQNGVLEKRLYRSTSDIAQSQAEKKNVVDENHLVGDIRTLEIPPTLTESKSEGDMIILKKDPSDSVKSEGDLSLPDSTNIDFRKKIFAEKRMSRSLYLNIECVGDKCREIPIIRQNSMPKFYLGSPEDHQLETAVFRTPSTALACPVPAVKDSGFVYNLSSVVQMEKERAYGCSNLPQVHDTSKRQFRDKIVKLRRIKSTMSAFQSHHM